MLKKIKVNFAEILVLTLIICSLILMTNSSIAMVMDNVSIQKDAICGQRVYQVYEVLEAPLWDFHRNKTFIGMTDSEYEEVCLGKD